MALRVLLLAAVLLLAPAGALSQSAACNVSQLSTQLEAALSTYDRECAPAARARVSTALLVRHAAVDEQTASVRLLADFYMSWEDKRLAWDAGTGCASALVAGERLWRPDVGALGAARGAGEAARARVSAEGRVRLATRLDLAAPLRLDLAAWPRDTHTVTFRFGSRAHTDDEIDLQLEELESTTVFESGAWELMSVESSTVEQQSGREAVFAVSLRRRAAAHALAADAARAAVALLLAAAALLPPTARAPLCAAASFTAVVWLAAAAARVGHAETAPRCLAAVGALCACGGVAAAAAAGALRLARCSLPPPRALRTLLTNAAALRKITALEVQGGEESSAWAAAAQLLDALCVLALLLTALLAALLPALY